MILNEMPFIKNPFLVTKIFDICLFFKTLTFLILRFSIKKRGLGFPDPKGFNFLISSNRDLFRALPDIFAS
jgi:hypothetical protein